MNDLIKETEQAKKIPGVIWASILSLIFVFIGASLVMFVPRIDMPEFLKVTLYDLILGFLGIVLMVYGHVKFIEKRSFRTIGFQKNKGVVKFIKGYIIGLGMFSVIVICSTLLGGFELKWNMNNLYLPAALSLLIGFVIQGSAEEVVFRGWLLPVIGSKSNQVVAVLISSSLFAFIHGLNPGITLLPIINLILFGVFAGVYALNEGSIWGICGYHAAWNWVQGSIYGIKVSGTTVPGGSLWTSMPQKDMTLLSGGTFGLEGSILCSIAFIMGTLWLIRKMRGRTS